MCKKLMFLISVAAVLWLGFAAPGLADVDYALIDFDRSGTQGTNETRIGDATARYSPWTIDTTSLTGDAYSITISASPGDNKFEFDDSGVNPAGAPFTATQKQGFVQRDGTADTVHIAFTGLAPGNYTLDAAAGADAESRWPIWSTTTGASVTDLTGTANGTAAIQAAWSFTVTSETGAQITINAASAGETNRGKVAAITLVLTAPPVPTIRFDSDASGDLETISPALIDVILESGEPDQTYAVDYAAVGGTATVGQDYIMPGGGPACWGSVTQCHGDTDDDGEVKGSDFLALKASWYKCDPEPGYDACADFDRDGCVKGSDFLILKSNWYKTVEANCPPEGGSATLEFAPGETSKTISIEIIDDGLDEEDETIIVELLNPAGPNVVLGEPNQHVYTIEDARPAVSFEPDCGSGMEDVSPAEITVNLTFASAEVVTVDYAATGGTATPGEDYILPPGTLTFSPGQTSKTIGITIVDDGVDEQNETIVITLSNPGNAKLGVFPECTYTIIDPSTIHLKVDFGYIGKPEHLTVKDGWIGWVAERWCDLYMHDGVGVSDIGGSGIDVFIIGVCEGRSGLKVHEMCMCNKAGGCCPAQGQPVGDPIANTWFTSVDRVSSAEGSMQLGIYQLPEGEYELTLYHNLWQPCSGDSRECTGCAYSWDPIVQIHVWSLDEAQALIDTLPEWNRGSAGDAHNKMRGFAGPDPGNNVTAIQEAFNVQQSTVTSDENVATSLVKFWTDGSPVIISCEAGPGESDQYVGDRVAINAFELKLVGP